MDDIDKLQFSEEKLQDVCESIDKHEKELDKLQACLSSVNNWEDDNKE